LKPGRQLPLSAQIEAQFQNVRRIQGWAEDRRVNWASVAMPNAHLVNKALVDDSVEETITQRRNYARWELKEMYEAEIAAMEVIDQLLVDEREMERSKN